MRCPKCGYSETKVIDTRMSKTGVAIRRRRECLSCGYRFTTTEEILRENLRVIKADGTREEFNRKKILLGIRKAIDGRPVEMERIEMIIADLIDRLDRQFADEIPTSSIGEGVMESLKEVDKIAWVRFAIAHKNIRDIAELDEELSTVR